MSQGCFSESQPRLSKLWTHQGIPGGSSSNASASEKLIQSIHQRQLTSRPFSRRLVTPMVGLVRESNPNGRNLQVTDLKENCPSRIHRWLASGWVLMQILVQSRSWIVRRMICWSFPAPWLSTTHDPLIKPYFLRTAVIGGVVKARRFPWKTWGW